MSNRNNIQGGVYHVVADTSADRWVVSQENADFRREFDVKKDAEAFAKKKAKKQAKQSGFGKVKVHKKSGRIDYELVANRTHRII